MNPDAPRKCSALSRTDGCRSPRSDAEFRDKLDVSTAGSIENYGVHSEVLSIPHGSARDWLKQNRTTSDTGSECVSFRRIVTCHAYRSRGPYRSRSPQST